MKQPLIQFQLLQGDIGEAGDRIAPRASPAPIDAIAVGHYIGVPPVDAELAIDEAISRARFGPDSRARIVTELAARNLIDGEAGRPFFLPDPRPGGRVIAVGGMGYPSQFALPELTALVRDLVWSLGLMGKKHLATVLIGSGNGNLPGYLAVQGWVQGAELAVKEAPNDESRLRAITFVEFSPRKFLEIHEALERWPGGPGGAGVEYKRPSHEEIERAREAKPGKARPKAAEFPRQLIVERVGHELSFGGIEADSLNQGQLWPYDAAAAANKHQEIVGAEDREAQLKLGGGLLRSLVPQNLHDSLRSNAPLLIVCDEAAAHIPWEMMALEDAAGHPQLQTSPENSFLGMARGLTRQIKLRAEGQKKPEPAFDFHPVLRVLVIADPAAGAHLPSAQEEGEILKGLFDRFNEAQRSAHTPWRVDARVLIGPAEAQTPDFVRDLLNGGSYDILHFAGHCDYTESAGDDSGWLFSGNQHFNARDLQSLASVPSLVVSNACESGRTPGRNRNLKKMHPTFAEAFFLTGVEFVCAAWQISDHAALSFAETFYTNLLGLRDAPQPVYLAMREGRIAAFNSKDGLASWGAYQHYGKPYFRVFA